MKGIILAGGNGTRLSPLTHVVSKQLLPVYDKPMIYYPLSTLILAGVTEILLICKSSQFDNFHRVLGDGSRFGISISYAVQDVARGIAESLVIGEDFVGDESAILILGDNIFYGPGLGGTLNQLTHTSGAKIFVTRVADPSLYGVVELKDDGRIVGLEEKPEYPKSDLAVTGLYFFDSKAANLAKKLTPSARGELEITDLLNLYLELNELNVIQLTRGTAWLDMGTIESLHEASEFVKVVERRHGLKIGCPEEVSFRRGLISQDELVATAERHGSTYGEYLLRIADTSDKTT